MFYGFGYPATKASGYSKVIPSYGAYTAPYGKIGKPFAKPVGKPIGKPVGKIGKPVGKIGGFGKGFPATKASGYNYVVPTTTVATSPYPGAI